MHANPTSDISISAFGCPQGVFKVDASGQAGYRLPVQVPPGAGGLQPQLEIAYNHRQANGILGVGWSVAGLSAISRVKANYAIDGFNGAINYDANDRLALDGQRLINVDGAYGEPGTVYYTEIHNWKQVRAGGPDQGFVVTMKNGEKWSYGCTPDSRITALGSDQVRVWALHSIEDLNGNRVEYQYTTVPVAGGSDGGAYYLERISYTVRDDLAPNRFVDFHYEQRPDPIVNYIGGHAIVTDFRLQRISTRLGDNTQVRSYALDYACGTATQLSRLVHITETGAADAGSPTLPAIDIDWQDTATPGFAIGAGSALEQHFDTVSQLSMDVSGSGRTGLVQLWLDQDKVLNATCYLPSGTGADVVFTRSGACVLGQFPADCQVFAADLNGDGRTDLLIAYRDGASGHLVLAPFLSNGVTFDAAASHDTGDGWSTDHLGFFAMDVNGDGRTDLVEAYGYNDPRQGQVLHFRSYLSRFGDAGASGFGPALVSVTADPAHPVRQLALWPMDVNGDGMVDLVRVWQDGARGEVRVTSYLSISQAQDQVYFSASKETNLGTLALSDQLAFLPADINGDGMMDMLQVWQEPGAGSSTLHLSTFISDGSGGFAAGPDSTFADQTINPDGFYPMSFSGGGQTQLLSKWVSASGDLMFTVFASSPSGQFRQLADVNAGAVGAAHKNDLLLVGDVNGDGKADLIRLTLDSQQQPVAYPYVSTGPYPDLVSDITDQLGAVTTIRYAPLSDAGVYSAAAAADFPQSSGLRYPNVLSPAQFPVQAVLGQALYVVAGYTQRNDPSRNRFVLAQEYAYAYENAVLDMLGRGWQGFAGIARLDLKTGLRTRQSLHQQFPLSGMLAALTLEADGRYSDDPRVGADNPAVLMSCTTSSYQCAVRANGVTPGAPAQPVYEVLLSGTRSAHYDYGSAHFDYATGTAYAYDDYGNKTRDVYLSYVDPATGEPLDPAQVVYRYNSYRNDVRADGWALGYLLYAKVSANATDGGIDQFLPGDYRLERREYDDGSYNLAAHSRWDNANHVFLTTSYGYDKFGKRTEVTQPGGACTSYTYEDQYNCYVQQTTSPPNAAGVRLCTRHGFDPRFGIEIAFQDENGMVFINALDGFGRQLQRQGPVPARSSGNQNALSPLVTGDAAMRQDFLAAVVCTLESTVYQADGTGGIYRRRGALQSFPAGGDSDFLKQTVYCDPLARDVLVAQESGHPAGDVLQATEYGAHGHPVSKSLPYFASASAPLPAERYRYDVLNRMLEREQPGGADGFSAVATRWDYAAGGAVTQTSAAGTGVASIQLCRHRFFDGHSKVVSSTMVNDDNACTVFRYDPLGRLLGSTDPATAACPDGISTAIVYDSLDRKTSVDNPDQNTTGNADIKALSYLYDPASGRLARQIDAARQTIDYRYDQLDRIVALDCSDGRTVAYQYDGAQPNGMRRLASVVIRDGSGAIESQRDYAYDVYGNASGVKLALDGGATQFFSSSVFDPQRRVVSHRHPDDSTLTRTYRSGMLVSQSLDGAVVNYPLEQYTASGRFGEALYGADTALTARYAYSPTSLLYGETIDKDADTVLQLAYGYDALNQLTSVSGSDPSGPVRQQFDYLHRRICGAALTGIGDARYTYDAAGNLLGKDGLTYRCQGHFTAQVLDGGTEVYAAQADACGRVSIRTVAGKTTRMDYDGQGNLRQVRDAAGGVVRDMRTDHLGQRLSQRDQGGRTIYVDAGYLVVEQGAGVAVTKFLIDGLGVVAAINTSGGQSSVQYFRRDAKGSITHVFGADGVLQGTLTYDSFGLPHIGGGAAPLAYEHRPWDQELGLYYFGSRYYDPLLARFLTPDTRLGSDSMLQPDAWNRYAFELNNPLNHIDPSGHSAEWVAGLFIGLATVAGGVLIVATGGAATGLVAVGIASLGGALIAGGATAVGYSVTHKDNFSWKGFGIQSGIAAGIGALTGGTLSALEAPIAASANPVLWGAVSGALLGGAADVTSQLLTNVATGANLSDGLAVSAIFGFATGGMGGALGAKFAATERAAERSAEQTAENGQYALRSYGAVVDPVDQVQEQLAASTARDLRVSRIVKKVGGGVVSLTAVPSAIFENESWYGNLS